MDNPDTEEVTLDIEEEAEAEANPKPRPKRKAKPRLANVESDPAAASLLAMHNRGQSARPNLGSPMSKAIPPPKPLHALKVKWRLCGARFSILPPSERTSLSLTTALP